MNLCLGKFLMRCNGIVLGGARYFIKMIGTPRMMMKVLMTLASLILFTDPLVSPRSPQPLAKLHFSTFFFLISAKQTVTFPITIPLHKRISRQMFDD